MCVCVCVYIERKGYVYNHISFFHGPFSDVVNCFNCLGL